MHLSSLLFCASVVLLSLIGWEGGGGGGGGGGFVAI